MISGSFRKSLSRQPAFVVTILFTTLMFAIVLAACGGSSSPTITQTPPPTSGTPAPSPAPTPTPTPTPTPGTPGSNPLMYQVQLVSNQHAQVTVGQVTVNPDSNNGDTEVKLNGTVASTQIFVKFCRFGSLQKDCINVGNFMTDASGNADAKLSFPVAGTWAGVFYLGNSADFDPQTQTWYMTEPAAFSGNFGTTQSYRVGLLPENSVSGGLDGIKTTQEPIASGFVSEVGSTLHVEVKGVQPNTSYEVGYCPNSIFGSGCNQPLNDTFTTDSAGNGSADMQETSAPSEIYFVDITGTRGQGYVTAFMVVK